MTEDQRPFDYDLLTYPHRPGHRGEETSIEAADHIEPHVGHLQQLALDAIEASGERGMTALEVCAHTGVDRIAMQPRVTELRQMGLIHKSGMKRKNPSGVSAIVWRFGPAPEAE